MLTNHTNLYCDKKYVIKVEHMSLTCQDRDIIYAQSIQSALSLRLTALRMLLPYYVTMGDELQLYSRI